MSLEEWLERESRQKTLHIELSGLRRVDELRRDDDKSVVQSCRSAGKGKFRSRLLADSFTAGEAGPAVTSLPLEVNLNFLEPETLAKLEAYGVLNFYGESRTSDGVVDDPDQLFLTLFLPKSLLYRFEQCPVVPQLHICVQGVETTHKGAAPGLSKFVWKNPANTPLYVSSVTLFDPEVDDDDEKAAPATVASAPSVVQMSPEFERRLFLWLGGIASLLFLLLFFSGR